MKTKCLLLRPDTVGDCDVFLFLRNFNVYDSPLKRGDEGVCKFAVTHPRPLFLEGSLKAATEGSIIPPWLTTIPHRIQLEEMSSPSHIQSPPNLPKYPLPCEETHQHWLRP